jgi:ATP-binding cassette subfamily C protein
VDAGGLFAREGTPQEAGADRAFLLAGDGAWWVEAGRIDVFAVRTRDGKPAGARRHLCRVGAGEPLLALGDAGDPALLAVGAPGTRLLALPRERLRAAGRGREAAAVLEGWAAALCAGVAPELVPKQCRDLEAEGEHELPAGTEFRPERGVAWVRHVAGSSLLLGRPGLRVNGDGWLPVSRRAWLEAADGARVALAGAPPGDEAWAGVERLHRLVLAHSLQAADAAAEAERERARRRAALDRDTLAGACVHLAGALDPAERGAPGMRLRAPEPGGEDALFAAARLVGDALGVEVRAASGPSGTRTPLDAIARASRLRTRRVLLRDGWWDTDSGPLLAFLEEGRRPVALLPVRGGGYVLCDPAERVRVPVDAGRAPGLAAFAHTFYRPFPEAPLRLAAVLRFGARGSGRDLAAVLGMGIAGGALAALTPVAVGVIFNSVLPESERGQLLQVTGLLLAVAVAMALFQLTRAVALIRVEGRMSATLQAAVWDRLLALPVGFFRGYTAGDLAERAMGVDAIRQVLSGTTVAALLGVIFSAFNFALLFAYDAVLAGWATLLVALALGVTGGAGWLQLRHQRLLARKQAEISGMVLQFLTGISKLRVAGAEVQAFAMWARRFAEQRRLRFAVRRIAAGLAAFNAAFPVAATLVIFAVASGRLDDPAGGPGLRTGDLLAFLAAFAAFLGAMLATSAAVVGALTVIPHYENASPILLAAPESDAGRADPGTLAGEIEVQHLRFRYGGDGPPVLDGLSLHVRPGEFVALVGASGSGKSTLLRLLLGFESPESGSVYFDGQELGGLDVLAVRRQIGVVLQNGRLMPGDVFSNIVGSSLCTLDDAWEAARMAGLDDDIRAMPMGMHTVVSEGGSTLSGGQRQRLLIARAVVTRPRILLFDEATSALDNRTQAVVSDSLARLQATRLVIAHRLSTIVGADRICVVQGGRVVQSGGYEALMREPGPFAELARRQLA